MTKLSNYLAGFLSISAVFLLGSGNVCAELSPEHKNRVRGEMREIWSKMTPEERELLRREDGANRPEAEGAALAPPKNATTYPSAAQASIVRPVAERPRQLSTEEHHHLRRQLKDIAVEVKP